MRMKNYLIRLSLILFIISCQSEKPVPLPADGTTYLLDPELKPFYHGVASGDPGQNSVILWTRVTPESTEPRIDVKWKISESVDMQKIVQKGSFTTDPQRDYTVKTEISKLNAGSTYYYQFEALNGESVVGRTRTLPQGEVDNLKLAVVSCSNYESGYFNAYDHIANMDEVFMVLHLGDYIYEYEVGHYGDPDIPRKHLPSHEAVTLQDYRTRYAQYRLDAGLRRAHQMHPFVTIYDDHEIANNAYVTGAENHQPEEGDFLTRKDAAVQAYLEWLPVKQDPDNMIYRTLRLGDLADLHMLDERLAGRTKPPDLESGDELWDKSREMLGKKQSEWLEHQILNSKANWQLIGNQVIFSGLNVRPVFKTTDKNLDSWDGYPAARKVLVDFIKDNKISNLIFLTGDTHAAWSFESIHDTQDQSYDTATSKGAIAVEFGTTSITSGGYDELHGNDNVEEAERDLMELNPHLKYVNLSDHGFLVLEITTKQITSNFYYVDRIDTLSSGIRLEKSVSAESGSVKLTIQ